MNQKGRTDLYYRFHLHWVLILGMLSLHQDLTSKSGQQRFLFYTSLYVAGRFVWNTINVTFRDPIGPSASQALMEWVRLHSESVTGRMGYAAGYKKDLDLEMLDPTGVAVEKWILQGTFLTDVNFDSLGYSDDALATITATLRPDRCILVY